MKKKKKTTTSTSTNRTQTETVQTNGTSNITPLTHDNTSLGGDSGTPRGRNSIISNRETGLLVRSWRDERKDRLTSEGMVSEQGKAREGDAYLRFSDRMSGSKRVRARGGNSY